MADITRMVDATVVSFIKDVQKQRQAQAASKVRVFTSVIAEEEVLMMLLAA